MKTETKKFGKSTLLIAFLAIFAAGCTVNYSTSNKNKSTTTSAPISNYRVNLVRTEIDKQTGGTTLSLFKVKIPREARETVFHYISEIGGTIIERGNPQFLLEVDMTRNSLGDRMYEVVATASIEQLGGRTGGRILMFLASSKTVCHRDRRTQRYVNFVRVPHCDQAKESAVTEALYKL